MSDWMPILTAPKDGTKFIIFITNEQIASCIDMPSLGSFYAHTFNGDCWMFDEGYTANVEDVTGFWMPLPEPPK